MTNINKVSVGGTVYDIEDTIARASALSAGQPVSITLASEMTDTDKIYLYLGSEQSYDYGYVYVYLNDMWTKTNVYGATTLQDGSITEPKFASALALKTIKDYVTPQMFGAKGDGTTDDTQAIINMFANSNGEMFFFPNGTYKITQNITIDNNDIDIVGAGMYSATLDFSDDYSLTINGYQVSVTGLKIQNADKVLSKKYHVQFSHCWFYSNYIGLQLDDSYIVQCLNCYFTHNKIGVVLNDESFETIFDNCVIDNNNVGIIVGGFTSGPILQNCTIEGNYDRETGKGCGVCLNYYSGSVKIDACWFEANGTSDDSCDIFYASQYYNATRFSNLYAQINSLYTLRTTVSGDSNVSLVFGRVIIKDSKFNYTKYGVATAGYSNITLINGNTFSGTANKNNIPVLFSVSDNITTSDNEIHCKDNHVINAVPSITEEMLSGINDTYIYSDLVVNTKALQTLAHTTQYFSIDGKPLYHFDRFDEIIDIDNFAGSSSQDYTMNIYANTAILYIAYDVVALISCNSSVNNYLVRDIYGTPPTVSMDSTNKTITISVPAYRKARLIVVQ